MKQVLFIRKNDFIFKGFPPGSVNIVTGLGETVGRQLVESPLVNKISFTGSTVVGKEIISKSAYPNIKRVSMELGGKSPLIILPDADI
jgi:acyl-CoA reductase-like NAD-dependent aldehyde dehydrogenase